MHKFEIIGDKRNVITNSLPLSHNTGIFPISHNDQSSIYDKNPSSIKELLYTIKPKIAEVLGCFSSGAIGVTLSGVVCFNYWYYASEHDAGVYEMQDKCDGNHRKKLYIIITQKVDV